MITVVGLGFVFRQRPSARSLGRDVEDVAVRIRPCGSSVTGAEAAFSALVADRFLESSWQRSPDYPHESPSGTCPCASDRPDRINGVQDCQLHFVVGQMH
jgi:hypothetical protein